MSKTNRERREKNRLMKAQAVKVNDPTNGAPKEMALGLAQKTAEKVNELRGKGARNIKLDPVIVEGKVLSVNISCELPQAAPA